MTNLPRPFRLAVAGAASVGLAFFIASGNLQYGLTAFLLGLGVAFIVWAIAATMPEL